MPLDRVDALLATHFESSREQRRAALADFSGEAKSLRPALLIYAFTEMAPELGHMLPLARGLDPGGAAICVSITRTAAATAAVRAFGAEPLHTMQRLASLMRLKFPAVFAPAAPFPPFPPPVPPPALASYAALDLFPAPPPEACAYSMFHAPEFVFQSLDASFFASHFAPAPPFLPRDDAGPMDSDAATWDLHPPVSSHS